jgi:hypothetical protein
LSEVEFVGKRNHIDGGYRNQLAITALNQVSTHRELGALVLQSRNTFRAMIAEMHGRDEHALAWLEPSDILTDLHDLSREITSENVWQLYARQAFAHPKVQMVHGAGLDSHQNLIFPRLGIRNIFIAQNLWTPKFVNANGFHMRNLRATKLSQVFSYFGSQRA